jgi:hypothetical protein
MEEEFDDEPIYIVDKDANTEDDEDSDLLITIFPVVPQPLKHELAVMIVDWLERNKNKF